jgi:hypothetical protein
MKKHNKTQQKHMMNMMKHNKTQYKHIKKHTHWLLVKHQEIYLDES